MSNGYLLSAEEGSSRLKDGENGGVGNYGSDRVFLNGNIARRRCASTPFVWWDTEIRGFGLFTRPIGSKNWIVHYRRRGKQVRKVLGHTEMMNASEARNAARTFLAQSALDGLPTPPAKKAERRMHWYFPIHGLAGRTVTSPSYGILSARRPGLAGCVCTTCGTALQATRPPPARHYP